MWNGRMKPRYFFVFFLATYGRYGREKTDKRYAAGNNLSAQCELDTVVNEVKHSSRR